MTPLGAGHEPTLRTLRAAAAHLFVDDLEAPELDEADEHHVRDVLRLGPRETIVVCDGAGAYRLARLANGAGSRRRDPVVIEATSEIVATSPPRYEITVAFGLAKGERGEWTVQKLTELGVDVVVPLLTERTVVRLDAAERTRRAERLRRVAREAAAQSRRTRLPRVEEPIELAAFVSHSVGVCFAEPGGRPISPADRVVAVGPEGGWSPAELELVGERVDLGGTVLRTETASLAAATLLSAVRGSP